MGEYIMGIDAGTSVVKAVIFDIHGHQVERAAETVPILSPKPNYAEEDMDQVWQAGANAILNAIVNARIKPEEIKAVGITGQGDGTWMIDSSGEPISHSYLWNDGRAGEIVSGWDQDGTTKEGFKLTGHGPYAGSTSALLRWRLENENIEDATLMWCKDWINFKLTGERATDPTDAALSIVDARKRTFSDEVLAAYGIEGAKPWLPNMRQPGDLVGKVTQSAAKATGLCEGTPVHMGMVDFVASTLGVGVAKPGECMAVVGTAGIVTVVTDDIEAALTSEEAVGWTLPYLTNTWVRSMGLNSATPNLDWFMREYGDRFRMASVDLEMNVYEFLDARIGQVPIGSNGVLYHPYTAPGGERAPFIKPTARASFTGISANTKRLEMLRAVYEGVTYGMRDCLSSIPIEVTAVRASGGGVNSPVWSQIMSDCYGLPVEIPGGTEFGAKGAAILAGVGAGIYSSLDEALDETIVILRSYEPDMAKHEIYTEFFDVYRRHRKALLGIWDDLAKATADSRKISQLA